MKELKRIYSLFLFSLLALTAAACNNGSGLAALSDIPVYEGSQVVKRGDNVIADTAADVVEDMAEEKGGPTEVRQYEVPAGASQNELYHFYATSLSADGWQRAGRIEQDQPHVIVEIWQRGEGEDQQALFIGMVDDELAGNGAFFVTALSTPEQLNKDG